MSFPKKDLLDKIAQENEFDAFLVYSPSWRKDNFRYVTGLNFFGPAALAAYITGSGKIVYGFDASWDCACARQKCQDAAGVQIIGPGFDRLVQFFTGQGVKRAGVSGWDYFPAAVAAALEAGGVRCVPADGHLEQARLVKTPEEVECLHAAVNLADQAFPTFLRCIQEGQNEFQIIAAVEYELKKLGAEDNFQLISTGGTEIFGMTPPQNRVAKTGDLVLTELTPQLNGWWAQICRTVVKGKANDNQRKAFDIFWEAEQAGLDALRPGVSISDVAKAENDVFRKYGYGDYTTSRYTRVRGHGHGMHLDEAPTVNEGVDITVQENMVIVIHPNTYNPLCGYMVLGDTVVVTKDGYRMLSTTERKLFEV